MRTAFRRKKVPNLKKRLRTKILINVHYGHNVQTRYGSIDFVKLMR